MKIAFFILDTRFAEGDDRLALHSGKKAAMVLGEVIGARLGRFALPFPAAIFEGAEGEIQT
jgi:hypothetical protein